MGEHPPGVMLTYFLRSLCAIWTSSRTHSIHELTYFFALTALRAPWCATRGAILFSQVLCRTG